MVMQDVQWHENDGLPNYPCAHYREWHYTRLLWITALRFSLRRTISAFQAALSAAHRLALVIGELLRYSAVLVVINADLSAQD